MSIRSRRLITVCIGGGLSLILAGLVPFLLPTQVSFAQDTPPATAEPSAPGDTASVTEEAPIAATPTLVEAGAGQHTVSAVQPTGDNGYCAVCHNQPWRAVTLTDGYVLNLYASPSIIANSVHGTSSMQGPLGCLDCHTEDAFPHSGPTPNDSRSYALEAVQMCSRCHQEAAAELEHGLHEQAIMTGNTDAAVCTDCHGAHDIQPAANHPQLVAGVCGDCHSSSLDEWRSSPHVDIGPLGCATCHSPHSQELRVGDSNTLCINCHTAPANIYVHQQHIDTEYAVECIDCHMHRDPNIQTTLVGVSPTGHTMMMDTRPCNTCHEELELTGTWDELTRRVDSQLISERDALQAQVSELQAQIATAPAEAPAPNNVQLLQGLILGLGAAITFFLIFGPRLARGNGKRDDDQS